MHDINGGEIIDATVTVVASIDVKQAHPTANGAKTRLRGKKSGKKSHARRARQHRREASQDKFAANFSGLLNSVDSSDSDSLSTIEKDADDQNRELEEDPSGYLVPKKILCKLECEGQEHPFFKRVWILRHFLDGNSPLLMPHARILVDGNNGFWPMELNNAQDVRTAFYFDQLLVSLSGTSNADANSVYAHHIYDIVDANVGYRFVNMLYRDPDDNSLHVDQALLSDVMEQAGGGAEDFSSPPLRERCDDMFVL